MHYTAPHSDRLTDRLIAAFLVSVWAVVMVMGAVW